VSVDRFIEKLLRDFSYLDLKEMKN